MQDVPAVAGQLEAFLSLDCELRAPLDQAQRGWNPWRIAAIAAAVVAGLAAALFPLMKPAVPVTSPSEYTQLTNFTDSATAPGLSPDGLLPEIIEVADHPWFIGVQFHPELKSRPFAPHPLFRSFIGAAVTQSRLV